MRGNFIQGKKSLNRGKIFRNLSVEGKVNKKKEMLPYGENRTVRIVDRSILTLLCVLWSLVCEEGRQVLSKQNKKKSKRNRFMSCTGWNLIDKKKSEVKLSQNLYGLASCIWRQWGQKCSRLGIWVLSGECVYTFISLRGAIIVFIKFAFFI